MEEIDSLAEQWPLTVISRHFLSFFLSLSFFCRWVACVRFHVRHCYSRRRWSIARFTYSSDFDCDRLSPRTPEQHQSNLLSRHRSALTWTCFRKNITIITGNVDIQPESFRMALTKAVLSSHYDERRPECPERVITRARISKVLSFVERLTRQRCISRMTMECAKRVILNKRCLSCLSWQASERESDGSLRATGAIKLGYDIVDTGRSLYQVTCDRQERGSREKSSKGTESIELLCSSLVISENSRRGRDSLVRLHMWKWSFCFERSLGALTRFYSFPMKLNPPSATAKPSDEYSIATNRTQETSVLFFFPFLSLSLSLASHIWQYLIKEQKDTEYCQWKSPLSLPLCFLSFLFGFSSPYLSDQVYW